MKRILLLSALAIVFSSSTAKKETVLICKGETSYAYHKDYCEGLQNCTKEVVKVSRKEAAKKYGIAKACGYCYKKQH